VAAVIHNEMLDEILAQVRPLIGKGKVADYIPALASVSGNKLGIAICTIDGQRYQAGMPLNVFPFSPFRKC
jgi:glutaminase